MYCHKIVLRNETGKLAVPKDVQEKIDKRVAFFLGNMARDFMSGSFERGICGEY